MTYSTARTYRYFAETDAFQNCFGACISTDTSDLGYIDAVFDTPVARAGGYAGAFVPWSGTVSFFDRADVLLGSIDLAMDTGGDLFAGLGGPRRHRAHPLHDTADNFAVLSLDRVYSEPVPEPATVLLLGSGIAGLALRSRRR